MNFDEIDKELIESVVNVYDTISKVYNAEFFEYDVNSPFIDEFLKGISNQGKILDAGCASGRDVLYMGNKGYDVIGIDLSDNFLDLAKKQVPNGKFFKMNACQLEFSNQEFDGILDAYVFMHFSKSLKEIALAEYGRVLKRGGKLLLLSSVTNGENYLDEPLLPGTKIYHCYYSDEEMKDLFVNSSFELDSIIYGNMSSAGELSAGIQAVYATKK